MVQVNVVVLMWIVYNILSSSLQIIARMKIIFEKEKFLSVHYLILFNVYYGITCYSMLLIFTQTNSIIKHQHIYIIKYKVIKIRIALSYSFSISFSSRLLNGEIILLTYAKAKI